MSHTDPYKADSSGDGLLDGWEVMWGLNPLVNNTAQSGQRSNFAYDPAAFLRQVTGVRLETIAFDAEGNIQQDTQ